MTFLQQESRCGDCSVVGVVLFLVTVRGLVTLLPLEASGVLFFVILNL